jgi:predicted metalloprotease with PDZ domain
MPLKIVGIPTARYDGDAIKATDASGALPLHAAEEPPTPQWINRHWTVARDTVGDVVLTYEAPPRQVTAATNNGPLFDLRREDGGFFGAGVGFLALPDGTGPYQVRLHWDLAQAPPGSRGVWSLGEGDVGVSVPAETLAYSYYAAGPLKSIPAEGGGTFALYWINDMPFDAGELGRRVKTLYLFMARFFGDAGGQYKVFIRQNPYVGRGGTSLAHSFMFGYNAEEKPSLDDLQDLLAHEITHNWPALDGEHGDTAWYSEGTAEYYSLLLSQRTGLLSAEQFLHAINERADAYYSNPFVRLSNSAAAKIFWTDPTAQTVPYGRGFMYLAKTDAAIRARSHGKKSLDDVVLELHRRDLQHRPHGIEQWIDLVAKELGREETTRGYRAMVDGQLLVPSERTFSPCFKVVKQAVPVYQLGFARSSVNDQRIVHGLEAGSAAARAGIRDGDVLVDVKGLNESRRDAGRSISLLVRREGRQLNVEYRPRGAPADAYRWMRDVHAPASSCKF